ncbi:MAG TPA: citrate/2-methylcitrate synthase, partial [Pyrinomonadaceae bacterium]|nr:citrate/2-methylcitrate synthase [Pyrinomonadaceae bacterium]
MENAKEAATAPATDKPKEESTPNATTAAAAATAGGTGLRGVVAASSSIGDVNGEQGILIYQGYDIHDLAEHSTFEETVYLLWHGRLPKQAELDAFKRDIGEHYELPPQLVNGLIRQFPSDAEPMDMLRTAVSALDFYDKECCDISREGALRTATRLTAQFPVLVA